MSDRHMSIMEWLGFRKNHNAGREEMNLCPNRKTRRELRQDRRGKNMRMFSTVEELMKDLQS